MGSVNALASVAQLEMFRVDGAKLGGEGIADVLELRCSLSKPADFFSARVRHPNGGYEAAST